ncbi:unnamed protein product, partial [Prunus brigantina]
MKKKASSPPKPNRANLKPKPKPNFCTTGATPQSKQTRVKKARQSCTTRWTSGTKAQAVGLAVTFEVESEAGETLLGEENWGGLEGPADVVAVAVDHEEEATWRGEEGQP